MKGTEKEGYAITLQGRGMAVVTNLTVDYIIFVERQKLGEKKGNEVVERVKGSFKVDNLGREPQVVLTTQVPLKSSNLKGEFIYSNGGRIKAEDSLEGIWIRVNRDGKQIAEYALPSTMTKRGWDK